MNGVVWLPIPGFSNYEVSSGGEVRRVVKDSRGHACRTLKPWIGTHGYKTVTLEQDAVQHRRLVHRLVCEAFHGAPPTPEHHVAHGDGTRVNNSAENLRWATRSENMADALKHGTFITGDRHWSRRSPEKTAKGERHGQAKITAEVVLAIRQAEGSPGLGRKLAKLYGLSCASISRIRSGQSWTHLINGENNG